MYFLTTDHVKLHYTDTQTAKPALLEIPGIGGSLIMWQKLNEYLERNFRIIMLDPRNQGRSQRTFKGQRMGRHAADVEELLAKLKLTEVVAVGNSMGASTFWAYLDQYGQGRLKAMIDLDQSPKMINDANWKYGFKDLTWDNLTEYLKQPLGKATYAQIDPELFQAAKLENQRHPYDPESNYDFLLDHATKDWRDLLLETPVPMLILAGKQSPYFNSDFVDEIADLNNKIKGKKVSNCGHLMQAEASMVVANYIKEFSKVEKI